MHALRREGYSRAAAIALAAVAAVIAGRELAHGYAKLELLLGGIALALYALGRWRRGVIIGVCVLGALNGLPGIDTYKTMGRFTILGDPFLEPLIVLGALWALQRDRRQADRVQRFALLWAVCFSVWCGLEVLRTIVISGLPIKAALANGHYYLYFALLIALLPRALRGRDDRISLTVTLGIGALLFSFAVVGRDLFHVNTGALIHASQQTKTVGGFTKDYDPVGDLSFAAVLFGIGMLVLGRGGRLRALGAVLIAICGTASALEFTRANYLAFLLAIPLASALWVVRRSALTERIRRFAVVLLASGIVAGSLIVIVSPSSSGGPQAPSSPIALVSGRLTSGVSEFTSSQGTVAARLDISRSLLHVLDGSWPIGLGFLDPQHHYVLGAVNGSIQEPDVGLLNALLPMGLVGVVLLYVPLLAALGALISSAGHESSEGWVRYGATIWLIALLITSVTLIVLFSAAGLVMTAVIGCASLTGLDGAQPGRVQAGL